MNIVNNKSISGKEMARRVVLVLFLIYFLFLIVHIFRVISSNNNFGYKTIEMKNDWFAMVDGKEYNDVDLDDFLPEKTLKRGDIVIIRNVLPKDMGNPTVIRLETYLAAVDVYVDNRIIYSYGDKELDNNSFVGSGINFIYLPDNAGGKTITIRLKAAENDAFTNIPSPYICHGNVGFIDYFRKNVLTIVSGLFLLMLGIVITIPSLLIEVKKGSMHRLTLIGLFSFCIGLWTCCNSKALQLFSLNITVNTIFEHLALYFAPIPFTLLVATVQQYDARWKRILMNGITTVFTAFPLIALILHITNVVHLPLMIKPFHLMSLILMILLLIVGVSSKNKTKETRLLNFGVIMMITVAVLDIVRFYVQRFIAPEVDIFRVSILPFGVVLFAIILILSYLTYLYRVLKEKASSETLRIMAYHDQLTGLYNRAKYDEVIDEIRDRHEIDYCLILFDLDGLKKTNDTYGHSMGDRLIKSFASNITEAFRKYPDAIVMRIGGDEFVVILDDISDEEIHSTMDELHNMNLKSSDELGFKVSASYGYCSGSFSKTGDPEDAYKIADSFMYSMKESGGYSRD